MDPNATLQMLLEASKRADTLADGDSNDEEIQALQEVQDHTENLIEWLANGGFAPDWTSIRRKVKSA